MELNKDGVTYLPGNICPYCERKADGVISGIDPDDMPEPGDISACFYCFEVSQFNEALILIKVDVSTLPIEVARTADHAQKSLAYFKSKGVKVNE